MEKEINKNDSLKIIISNLMIYILGKKMSKNKKHDRSI
jgi:hypothetical protein